MRYAWLVILVALLPLAGLSTALWIAITAWRKGELKERGPLATVIATASGVLVGVTLLLSSLRTESPTPPVVYFVLDTSARMGARFGSGTKLETAKGLVLQHHQVIVSDTLTALRTFGGSIDNRPACESDTRQRIPPGAQEGNEGLFRVEVPAFEPAGSNAPLNSAILGALHDVSLDIRVARRLTLVIVTGGYDTCVVDSFRQQRVLEQVRPAGDMMSVFIVGQGADPKDRVAKEQMDVFLANLRTIGGIRNVLFIDAQDAEQFQEALRKATTP